MELRMRNMTLTKSMHRVEDERNGLETTVTALQARPWTRVVALTWQRRLRMHSCARGWSVGSRATTCTCLMLLTMALARRTAPPMTASRRASTSLCRIPFRGLF